MAAKTPKPLKYKLPLQGLTQRQMEEHHGVLYTGYVKKWNEIQDKLKTVDKSDANGTFSMLRELKLEETFAKNAIVLHEGFFDNLGGDGKCIGDIQSLIQQDFGSFEAWEAEFKAMGICARGWVVLAYDWNEGRLTNFLCDVHNQGGVWGTSPLLILDVYEHAYFLDYATARKSYIDAFMRIIDWNEVNKRISEIGIMQARKAAASRT